MERRLRCVQADIEVLGDLFKDGTRKTRTESDIPRDAVLKGMFPDPEQYTVTFVFYHPSFEITESGLYPPKSTPIFHLD